MLIMDILMMIIMILASSLSLGGRTSKGTEGDQLVIVVYAQSPS